MKNRIVLLAVALSIAVAVPAFADSPSDASLVIENRAPEMNSPQTTQPSEAKARKKERKPKAQPTAKQQSSPQATAQQSGSGMH